MMDEVIIQRAAMITSASAAALIEMEAMKALNAERRCLGQSQAYSEEAFRALRERLAQEVAALY